MKVNVEAWPLAPSTPGKALTWIGPFKGLASVITTRSGEAPRAVLAMATRQRRSASRAS